MGDPARKGVSWKNQPKGASAAMKTVSLGLGETEAQGQRQTLDPRGWSSSPILFPRGIGRTTGLVSPSSWPGRRCRWCRTAPAVFQGRELLQGGCDPGCSLQVPCSPVRRAAPVNSLCRPLTKPAVCGCARISPRERNLVRGYSCF